MFPNAGKPLYMISFIEFQKHSLPHTHILIKYPHKYICPQDIDQVISTTMPIDRDDTELVSKFMIHQSHPENVINHIPPNANHLLRYCERWKDNAQVCRFGYPKPITQETAINGNGRIHYAQH
jgi:hypothetical protein